MGYRVFPLRGVSEGNIYRLYFEFAIDATGAVGTVTRNRHMGTPVRNSTGDYTVPLKNSWGACVGFGGSVVQSSVASTDGTDVHLKATTLGTTSSPSFEFLTIKTDGTGAVGDPANGAVIKGWIDVQAGRAI